VRTADEDHTSSDIALRDAQKNLPTGKIGLVISMGERRFTADGKNQNPHPAMLLVACFSSLSNRRFWLATQKKKGS
jgi:hypothetical protein